MGVHIIFHLGPITISNEDSWLTDLIYFNCLKQSDVFFALHIPNKCEMVSSHNGKSGNIVSEW